MRKLTSLLAAAALVAAIPMTGQADGHQRTFADVYADCGIGAMLFSGNSDNDRILAIISNVTWDLGTTAHSSNMSSAENCKSGGATAALFILENLPQIEGDIAKGEGEHLAAAVHTFGCESQLDSLTVELREQTKLAIDNGSYATMDAQDKSAQIYNTINTSCTI
ncbi:MAG: DUF3015 family protein [Granulosicoccaceae bacterium]